MKYKYTVKINFTDGGMRQTMYIFFIQAYLDAKKWLKRNTVKNVDITLRR